MKILRASAAIVVALVAALVSAQPISAEQKSALVTAIHDTLQKRAFVPGLDFKKFETVLAGKQKDLDAADSQTGFAAVINNALREFGISHIRLQTPRAAEARTQTKTIGVGITTFPAKDGLMVRRVVEASPADKAGIRVGDVILRVNGKAGASQQALSGERGATLELEIRRPTKEVETVSVPVDEYSTVRKETLTWAAPDAAVLRIYTFSTGYSRENVDKLMREVAKAKYLVVDLRSNGGGATNNLNHLLSLLMPDGTVYGTMVSRRVMDDYVKANPGKETTLEALATWTPNKVKTRKRDIEPFPGKIAVLINRGSASASEIAAAGLRDGVGAKIVGTKSAGAVLASIFSKLPDGWAIQIPVSDFVTAKGARLEHNPVVPDLEVTGRAGIARDRVVEAALELLRR